MPASRIARTARGLLALVLFVTGALDAQTAAFDKAEFAARRTALFEKIGDGLALVFAAEEPLEAIRFRQSNDFFYLTGIEDPGGILLLNGATKQAVLFAYRRPAWKANSEGPGLRETENPTEIYGLPIQPLEGFYTALNNVAAGARTIHLPLTPHDDLLHGRSEIKRLTAATMEHPVFARVPVHQLAIDKIRQLHPHLQVADLSPRLDTLRWVKRPYEIARMREAGRIGAEAVAEAMRGTKPGMFEYEIAAKARYVNAALGARGDAFLPIVASGPNTMIVHYTANNRKIASGDVVYIDYGSDFDYYTSDITRTWPGGGKFTAEQEKMYRCILEARNAIIAAMKPGITVAQMKDIAEPIYEKYGFKQEFINSGRYVGHHTGMSVHDVGGGQQNLNRPFVPGVVYNVEPLLAVDATKTHVRLEDTILITETGAVNLTAAVPAELEQVYALVRDKGLQMGPRIAAR